MVEFIYIPNHARISDNEMAPSASTNKNIRCLILLIPVFVFLTPFKLNHLKAWQRKFALLAAKSATWYRYNTEDFLSCMVPLSRLHIVQFSRLQFRYYLIPAHANYLSLNYSCCFTRHNNEIMYDFNYIIMDFSSLVSPHHNSFII